MIDGCIAVIEHSFEYSLLYEISIYSSNDISDFKRIFHFSILISAFEIYHHIVNNRIIHFYLFFRPTDESRYRISDADAGSLLDLPIGRLCAQFGDKVQSARQERRDARRN